MSDDFNHKIREYRINTTGNISYQYNVAGSAPLLNSTSNLLELVSNTLISVPCYNKHYNIMQKQTEQRVLYGFLFTL